MAVLRFESPLLWAFCEEDATVAEAASCELRDVLELLLDCCCCTALRGGTDPGSREFIVGDCSGGKRYTV